MIILQSFEILGLNAEENVKIFFEGNKKIVVAENGSGKTTILNILYHCLCDNKAELIKYEFNSCILTVNNTEIKFNKNEIFKILDKRLARKRFAPKSMQAGEKVNTLIALHDYFLKYGGIYVFEEFLYKYFKIIINFNSDPDFKIKSIIDLVSKYEILPGRSSRSLMFENLLQIDLQDLEGIQKLLVNSYTFSNKSSVLLGSKDEVVITVIKMLDVLLSEYKFNSSEFSYPDFLKNIKKIYLPTYRRIEHDSNDLFDDIKMKENTTLSFGMVDVELLFKKIEKKVEGFIKESFNEINSKGLNNFISGTYITYKEINVSEDYFLKVLKRVGMDIEINNQEKLLKIVRERSTESYYLNSIIRKMCEIYEKQAIVEEEINKYIKVCNKYLSNKEIRCDESNLKISIWKRSKHGDEKEIKLSNLSSGEKQIISLFAKLYLYHLPDLDLNNIDDNKSSGYWIFFDEPELSLSVEWQEMLLPDILESKRCDFLFATTHSPFIFNNELKYITTDIRTCMSEFFHG